MSDDYATRIRQLLTDAADEMGRPLDPAEHRLITTFVRFDELIVRAQTRPWWASWRAHPVGRSCARSVHDEPTATP